VLGLTEVARRDFGEGPTAFLSTGNSHHDIALVETGAAGSPSDIGLHHFALKVGDSRRDLAWPVTGAGDRRPTDGEQDRAPDTDPVSPR
jgi:hypothetical protein